MSCKGWYEGILRSSRATAWPSLLSAVARASNSRRRSTGESTSTNSNRGPRLSGTVVEVHHTADSPPGIRPGDALAKTAGRLMHQAQNIADVTATGKRQHLDDPRRTHGAGNPASHHFLHQGQSAPVLLAIAVAN